MGDGFTILLTNKGDLYASGSNMYGQCGIKINSNNVSNFTLIN